MSLSVADLVVAVNGAWMLVETFMLKGEPSKGTGLACRRTWPTCFFFLDIFIYLQLCWVFVARCRFSLVVESRGLSPLRCTGFSLQRLLLCGARALGTRASVGVAPGLFKHRLSCSAAYGISPYQALNPCPLRWQADS